MRQLNMCVRQRQSGDRSVLSPHLRARPLACCSGGGPRAASPLRASGFPLPLPRGFAAAPPPASPSAAAAFAAARGAAPLA